jgi:hypothetical protein
MIEKQVALKVFDEREMVDKEYSDIYVGDEETHHWYMYREPEPQHPNSKDIQEDHPE